MAEGAAEAGSGEPGKAGQNVDPGQPLGEGKGPEGGEPLYSVSDLPALQDCGPTTPVYIPAADKEPPGGDHDVDDCDWTVIKQQQDREAATAWECAKYGGTSSACEKYLQPTPVPAPEPPQWPLGHPVTDAAGNPVTCGNVVDAAIGNVEPDCEQDADGDGIHDFFDDFPDSNRDGVHDDCQSNPVNRPMGCGRGDADGDGIADYADNHDNRCVPNTTQDANCNGISREAKDREDLDRAAAAGSAEAREAIRQWECTSAELSDGDRAPCNPNWTPSPSPQPATPAPGAPAATPGTAQPPAVTPGAAQAPTVTPGGQPSGEPVCVDANHDDIPDDPRCIPATAPQGASPTPPAADPNQQDQASGDGGQEAELPAPDPISMAAGLERLGVDRQTAAYATAAGEFVFGFLDPAATIVGFVDAVRGVDSFTGEVIPTWQRALTIALPFVVPKAVRILKRTGALRAADDVVRRAVDWVFPSPNPVGVGGVPDLPDVPDLPGSVPGAAPPPVPGAAPGSVPGSVPESVPGSAPGDEAGGLGGDLGSGQGDAPDRPAILPSPIPGDGAGQGAQGAQGARPAPVYQPIQPDEYRSLGAPASGQRSSTEILEDRAGNRYVFKDEPTTGADAALQIQAGTYSQRAAASRTVASELGINTPDVRLVDLGGRRGTLQPMVDMESLQDLRMRDPDGYRRLVQSAEYQVMSTDVDALRYLTNNVDGGNLENVLVNVDGSGRLRELLPIDLDTTFSRLDLSTRENLPPNAFVVTVPPPGKYTRAMHQKLLALSQNREALTRQLQSYLDPAEVDATLARLDAMLADIDNRLKTAPNDVFVD